MKDIDGLELSPRKLDYIKFIYEKGGAVKTNDLSKEFDVDPSTITKAIIELGGTGFVEHEPYRGVRLTESGKEYAEFLIRRHRILSLVLSHYGLNESEACEQASKLEGYVSKETIDKMCNSLGHPTMGICGRIKHDVCCCCPDENAGSD